MTAIAPHASSAVTLLLQALQYVVTSAYRPIVLMLDQYASQ